MFPKVIHPVKVILHHRLETEQDEFLGPTGKIEWSEPIILKGQVKYDTFKKLIAVPDGNDPANDGHIVFYAKDWDLSGGTVADELELEDSSRLIITEIRPAAHYYGRFWHVHVYFTRRRTR